MGETVNLGEDSEWGDSELGDSEQETVNGETVNGETVIISHTKASWCRVSLITQ